MAARGLPSYPQPTASKDVEAGDQPMHRMSRWRRSASPRRGGPSYAPVRAGERETGYGPMTKVASGGRQRRLSTVMVAQGGGVTSLTILLGWTSTWSSYRTSANSSINGWQAMALMGDVACASGRDACCKDSVEETAGKEAKK